MGEYQAAVSSYANGYVVKIAGRVGGPEGESLEKQLDGLVALKPGTMVLDLSGAEFLSSRALSVLIRLNRMMKEAGGKTRMAAVPAPVMQLIKSVRLDDLMPMFLTVEEATR